MIISHYGLFMINKKKSPISHIRKYTREHLCKWLRLNNMNRIKIRFLKIACGLFSHQIYIQFIIMLRLTKLIFDLIFMIIDYLYALFYQNNETYFLKRKCEIIIHEIKILRSALNTTSF